MSTLPPPWPPEQPQPQPPPEPPRRRFGAVVALVGVLVVVALVAGAVALGTRDDGGADSDASTAREPAPSSPTTAGASSEDDLQAAVRELSEFVADERGRPFEDEVDVELLDDDAFVERLRSLDDEDDTAVDESGRLLRAVGLLDADDDLAAAVEEASAEGVLGFYDPEGNALVVRGSELSVGVQSTLVHELTHAWDDQHFELDRPQLDEADDESGLGFSSLLEGNAMRVEEAWQATLSPEERVELRADEGSAAERFESVDVPPVVLQLLTLPYVAGPGLVQALLRAGGEARIDAAFQAPPTTSEQVLDPGTFLDGPEPAVPVAEPAADGPVTDRGVWGSAGVLITLVDRIPPDDARLAAEGWGGDRYVTWADGDRTCVRIAFAGDDAGDVGELGSAWSAWAEEADDAEVQERGGRVVVTSCG